MAIKQIYNNEYALCSTFATSGLRLMLKLSAVNLGRTWLGSYINNLKQTLGVVQLQSENCTYIL